jgi:hypothetical protein
LGTFEGVDRPVDPQEGNTMSETPSEPQAPETTDTPEGEQPEQDGTQAE